MRGALGGHGSAPRRQPALTAPAAASAALRHGRVLSEQRGGGARRLHHPPAELQRLPPSAQVSRRETDRNRDVFKIKDDMLQSGRADVCSMLKLKR